MKLKKYKGELHLLKNLKDGSVVKYRFVKSDLSQLENLKIDQKVLKHYLKTLLFYKPTTRK